MTKEINMTNWGVRLVLPRTEQKYPYVPVMFCDIAARKERMLAAHGRVYEKIKFKQEWKTV